MSTEATRRRRRRLGRVAALACLLSFGASPAHSQTPGGSTAPAAADSTGRLRIPEQMVGFTLQTERCNPAGTDVILRYAGPDSLSLHVFVYPGPDFARDCDSACAGRMLEQEVVDFRASFPEMIRRRFVDTISVESDAAVQPKAGSGWRLARRIVLATRRAGQAERSELHLFYLRGVRVKIRATYVPTAARIAAVAALADALIPELLLPPAGTPPT
jgi:hypothetical protein